MGGQTKVAKLIKAFAQDFDINTPNELVLSYLHSFLSYCCIVIYIYILFITSMNTCNEQFFASLINSCFYHGCNVFSRCIFCDIAYMINHVFRLFLVQLLKHDNSNSI
jgi:hypothetical protein